MPTLDRDDLRRVDRQLVRAAIPALCLLALLWVVLMAAGAVPVAFGAPVLLVDLLAAGGFYVAHRIVRAKIARRTEETFRRR